MKSRDPQLRYLLTDVDDVLLNWMGGFKKFLDRKGIGTYTPQPKTWELEGWISVSHDLRGLINEFNISPEFGELEAYDDAKLILPQIAKNHKIVAITSCSSLPETIALRKMNLINHFGDIFEEVHCIDLLLPKRPFLDLYKGHSVSAWVEDKLKGAVEGHDAGFISYLMCRPHNQTTNHDNILRVKSWTEILAKI